MTPLKPPYPKWYDPNASCMYHAENQGHSTENCLTFERRVQDLVDVGILHFDGVSNVVENPLPNNTDRNVNAVTNEDGRRAKSCVAKIKMSLQKVWEMMVKKGFLCPQNRIIKEENIIGPSFCNFHSTGEHEIQSCKGFRELLQDMTDNKEVKIFDRKEEADEGEICVSDDQPSAIPYSTDRPLVIYYEAKKEEVKPKEIIEVPSPFPYKDNKAVQWRYDVNIVVPEGEKSKATTRSLSEVGHFTRSGRCYSPKMVEPKMKAIDSNQKGKTPMHEDEINVEMPSEQEVKKPVNEEEAHEFLKFIKHKLHQNALLKVLNQAYVASNVYVEKLDRWINNLNADNFISFSDDEIPPSGRGSVKALHITTSCKCYIVPNVLINNGFALNVMLLATLSKMLVDMSYLRPCHSTVRAFDGTR
ncbi:uncharacterized protein LOC128032528 [Gossypium raimondii]|uniref:uncharacterized protein LOC128032528 n=1 Tax=Gossypium raimondii TaxID=29730 RepID=UPI00227ACD73|nr:uncharacterized protein LOC128032528 [Gossypium raimondii]